MDALGEMSGDRQRSPDAGGKLAFDNNGHICLSFGKYKGWTLESIGRNDPGYLQWLMTKAELPASTLHVMRSSLAHTKPQAQTATTTARRRTPRLPDRPERVVVPPSANLA